MSWKNQLLQEKLHEVTHLSRENQNLTKGKTEIECF